MNSKLVKASLAGAAAIAVAAGGGTYASWSDFGNVTGNTVGAGHLVLDIGGPNGSEAVQTASFGNFAPGEGKDVTRYLASQQGDAVPTADLKLTMTGLQNDENGCASNSEKSEESTCVDNPGTGGGEFGHYANIKIEASAPTTAGNCGTVTYSTVYNGTIDNLSNAQQALGSLSNGEGICVRSTVTLPSDAPNATQGDSSSWTWRYDLIQA